MSGRFSTIRNPRGARTPWWYPLRETTISLLLQRVSCRAHHPGQREVGHGALLHSQRTEGKPTMIAAVYARKSTEQNRNDEEKSVARQIDQARAYAARKGWTIVDEHIYVDDGISGAEFIKRPGFLRLINALKPKVPFQVLIMSEESRLGREQIETAYSLKQIIDVGVR